MAVKNNSFEFTYSAKQQKEIEEIRKKYLPKEEDKMETLRRLDRSAEKPGTMAGIVVGVIGTMLLGVGMCCTMVWADTFLVLGIVVGIIGIGILSTGYPLYKKITRKQREKIAGQILALSEELSL
ncbi:MAG: hypothetical protein IJ274_04360 [Lachnospiraceae bacterium]|nr:hypothetical protein [Lachnospiraceae bacterium]